MSPLHVFFAIAVAVLWGGNYVAAKFGVAYFPPFYLTALRFAALSVLLIPFVQRPTWPQMKQIMVLSTMSTFHFSLIFVAMSYGLDISTSAVLAQLGVPFACIFGAVFLNDRLGLWRSSGIVIAFIGTAIVAGTPNILQHMDGFYAALGSTITWGAANVLIKRIKGVNSMALLAWMGLYTVPMLFLLSYAVEYKDWPSLAEAPLSAVLGLVYTIIGSTVFAYGLWYFLLARYSVSQVTPYSLLTPIFGIAFGQWFFAEDLTTGVLVGGFLTIVGVAVIVMRRPKTIMLGEAT